MDLLSLQIDGWREWMKKNSFEGLLTAVQNKSPVFSFMILYLIALTMKPRKIKTYISFQINSFSKLYCLFSG